MMKSKLEDKEGGGFRLTIDRSEWLPKEMQNRGGPNAGGFLHHEGRQCCLGVLISTARVKEGLTDGHVEMGSARMAHEPHVIDLVPDSIKGLLLKKLVDMQVCSTAWCFGAARRNDTHSFNSLDERERDLIDHFATENIELIFVGELKT